MTIPVIERPVMELRGVSKRFGTSFDLAARLTRAARRRLGATLPDQTVRAVDRVDMAIHKGEVVGLVGESGCGKSTLGRMVAGIMPATEGEVLYRGKNISAMPAEQARKATLAVSIFTSSDMTLPRGVELPLW